MNPASIPRIMKEIRQVYMQPPAGMKVFFSEDKMNVIQADIQGPESTPFEGGVFRVKLVLGDDYPTSPPKGVFLTKIFHPNVSKIGEICVNTLKKDWQADLGIKHVLIVIRCLLCQPNPDSALNEDAGKLLNENYEEYCKRAKLWTQIHAKPKPKGKEGKIEESQNQAKENKEINVEGEPKAGKQAGEGADPAKKPAAGAPAGAPPAAAAAKAKAVTLKDAQNKQKEAQKKNLKRL
jgi:ubiquitin-conjugating enzyme E2 S